MAISIRPLSPTIGGEVDGADLTKPLTPENVAAIEAGMDKYAVLVFHNQNFTDEQQKAFTRNFGELEVPSNVSNIQKAEARRIDGTMADVSNLDQDHKPLAKDDRIRMFGLGNRLWHSDSSFRAVPAKYSLLSGRIVPAQGGNTEFADMRAAYDALHAKTKAKIEDLVCEHSLLYSRGKLGFEGLTDEETKNFKPVYQRLVRTHPITGRKSLYLSAHIGKIIGWPTPEARIFIQDLTEDATKPEFVYKHQWKQHDFVMWDNRQAMHRVRAFNDLTECRDMRRTTVAGEEMTVEQAA